MRIFLILLFILVSNTVYAKNVGGKKICEGFCKGEEYVAAEGGGVISKPWNVVINGKKKKVKFQHFFAQIYVNKSWCKHFEYHTFLGPRAKKDEILDIVYIDYDINVCLPCPPNFKKTSSGYCPLTAFKYRQVYEKYFYYGLWQQKSKYIEDYKVQTKPHRGFIGDLLIFRISAKKDLYFWKYFSKSKNKYMYKFITADYKTPFKQQVVKTSGTYELKEKKFKTIVDNISNRIENSWDLSDLNANVEKLYKRLYGSIPTNDEMDLLIETFSELREFYYQLRN